MDLNSSGHVGHHHLLNCFMSLPILSNELIPRFYQQVRRVLLQLYRSLSQSQKLSFKDPQTLLNRFPVVYLYFHPTKAVDVVLERRCCFSIVYIELLHKFRYGLLPILACLIKGLLLSCHLFFYAYIIDSMFEILDFFYQILVEVMNRRKTTFHCSFRPFGCQR